MISFSTRVITLAPHLDIGYALLRDIKGKKTHPYLEGYQRKTILEIQSQCSLFELKKIPNIHVFRELYWLFKMDPTKIRPSAEALARRILSGEQLPQIDTVVDCVNCVSLRYLLPISCFDRESLSGHITVRHAKKGEVIKKIRGIDKELKGEELVLSDRDKIICLGYASMDSWETRIHSTTKDLAVLVYQAPGIEKETVRECLQEVCDLIITVNGGTVQTTGRFARGQEGG